ncbi:hypothetical protein V8G54_005735 [Vigna mungo]|uniref:Uncharacterized protein n=1 Tax=Vigna mungo TaxID=3915 RepID=A0AAQ3P209_VIGMU
MEGRERRPELVSSNCFVAHCDILRRAAVSGGLLADAMIVERIPFCYAVYMPSIPALRKEYGLLLVRCGLIGEAMKEFEDLELWDNLIYCYSLLEKKASAVELIRKCLSERPNDPRLWCSLGDTTANDAYYEKALEVSNNRSARAKRTLAHNAYCRGEYVTSKILWESAMSMNSMYPNGWFSFGAAALKIHSSYLVQLHNPLRVGQKSVLFGKTLLNKAKKRECSTGTTANKDRNYIDNWSSLSPALRRTLWWPERKERRPPYLLVDGVSYHLSYAQLGIELLCQANGKVLQAQDKEKALDAFTRAVQLDPENGEAWNNIACLRNSWRMWETYGFVAVDIGNISQALEAVQMILDMTNNKVVDSELLERITTEVEKRVSTSNVPALITENEPKADQFHVAASGSEYQEQVSDAGRSRETEQLFLLLGKVLQQIVKSGSGCGPDIWGLYAKWHRINGDLTMCSEALLKQVRSLQGSDVWKDRDRFKKFAKASLELCQVYVEIVSSTGSIKQLATAEMHLKNVIRQAESFSDTDEFRDLQACYDEVKIKLQSNSMRG